MFGNRISQMLHDEHRATVALMERLETLLARHRRAAPDVGDRAVGQLLAELAAGVEDEVQRHFAFEEDRLFGYLETAGDAAIGEHLADEHSAMRPLGVRLAGMAREAAGAGFDAARWDEFRRVGQELCERMLAHVQKEEMALLPLIDEMMDPATEAELFDEYAQNM